MSIEKTIKRAVTLQLIPFGLMVLVMIYSLIITARQGDFSLKELITLPLILLLLGGVFYFIYRRKLKPASHWIKKIEEQPQDLVWLKPTEVKQKMFVVMTVAKTAQFELFDKEKNVVNIDSSIMRKGLIIREFMDRLPDIHYGWSKEIEKIYKKHPDNFIEELKKRDLYFPVKDYQM